MANKKVQLTEKDTQATGNAKEVEKAENTDEIKSLPAKVTKGEVAVIKEKPAVTIGVTADTKNEKKAANKAENKTATEADKKVKKNSKSKTAKTADKAAKSNKTVRAEKADKVTDTSKTEKAAKAAKTTKSTKSDKEVKAEKTTKAATKRASKKTATAAKEAAPKKRTAKKEVKETADNIEQVAGMINEEMNKAVKKSKKVAPEKKKILFVGSEVLPFAATGGLGEVLGSLPKALAARGDYDVRVIMPYYSDMGEQYRNSAKYLCNYNVGLSWRNLYCGLFELKQDNVTYYFIDNEYYFHRDGLYGFYDDGERYAFFCKAVMDSFYFIDFMPDIIHANDWQTALIPIYNNCKYHYDVKLIFTIHNIEYQGQYDLAILPTVFDLPPEAGAYVEYEGCINLVKGAIETSDCVTTVSESYAKELEDKAFAHGLEEMIRKNSWKTRGILNGIDAEGYNPATDTAIAYNFTSDDFSGKVKDKLELQKLAGLKEDAGIPVIAIISRLVAHKGLDLITRAMEDIIRNTNVQLVILGKGDRKYEDYFIWLQNQYGGKVSAMITYNKELSRKVYAGADIFLMPSKAEPCGLSQMIACRYGTVPVVRETGGLRDSITDCSLGEGNGFTFANYDPDDMANAIYRSIDLYYNRPEDWDKLRKYITTIDFSWANSAGKYDEMYSWLLGR